MLVDILKDEGNSRCTKYSSQFILARELIAFIVDGFGAECDPIIVHVYLKLYFPGDNITLVKVRFILWNYEQCLNKNNLLVLDAYSCIVNYASQTHSSQTKAWRDQYEKNNERFRNYNQAGAN